MTAGAGGQGRRLVTTSATYRGSGAAYVSATGGAGGHGYDGAAGGRRGRQPSERQFTRPPTSAASSSISTPPAAKVATPAEHWADRPPAPAGRGLLRASPSMMRSIRPRPAPSRGPQGLRRTRRVAKGADGGAGGAGVGVANFTGGSLNVLVQAVGGLAGSGIVGGANGTEGSASRRSSMFPPATTRLAPPPPAAAWPRPRSRPREPLQLAQAAVVPLATLVTAARRQRLARGHRRQGQGHRQGDHRHGWPHSPPWIHRRHHRRRAGLRQAPPPFAQREHRHRVYFAGLLRRQRAGAYTTGGTTSEQIEENFNSVEHHQAVARRRSHHRLLQRNRAHRRLLRTGHLVPKNGPTS